MMNDGKQQSTFLFHDYETFGTHPALDRPAQLQPFALITNSMSSANPKSFTASPRMTIYPSLEQY